jgi:hypothetical protein
VSDSQIAKYQSFGAVLNTARGEMEQFNMPAPAGGGVAAFAAAAADEDEDDLYN